MRLIDETAYQDKLAKIPMGERFFAKAVEIAQHMPTIDAVEVVHGEWILLGKNEHDYETSVEEKCSLCGRYVYRYDTELQDNYCPNCGCKMDKEDET